ncbi:hypothetical protein NSMM_290004 [Nitrosomonas mobilis]|uniref:Transposase n=1 Tax=Nitrosomonas mobilis TaxID=51642 RepID=A0A1G5SCE3_9PROT|nr:hypothetical protein NSMM_290004 [Nitrosomonas mobilis]
MIVDAQSVKNTDTAEQQSLLCGSGYVGQPFAQGVREILGAHVQVQTAKRSKPHTFKVMLKR